jgi:hypothetical protein
MSLHPSNVIRRAAFGLTTVAALGAASFAYAGEAAKATTPVTVTPAATKLDDKLCDGALETLVSFFDVARQVGKPPSPVLVESMANWGEAGCPYPYTVQWAVVPGDTANANRDATLFEAYAGELLPGGKMLDVSKRLKLPDISFNKLGIKRALKPSPLPAGTKPSASLEKGPG